MTVITDSNGNVIGVESDTLKDWRQAAQVEAGIRRELQAENARLREALRQIVEWEPATQELTLANEMADVAKRALG